MNSIKQFDSKVIKFIVFALLGFAQASPAAVTFPGSYVQLPTDSTTNSTSLTNTGLSVPVNGYSGSVFVVSTFSGEKSSNSTPVTASYQLNNGSSIGQAHQRFIAKDSRAAGAGSALGIASISSNVTFSLHHADSAGSNSNLTTLSGSTLTAIPLSSGSASLNHAAYSLPTAFSTSSGSPDPVATTGLLNVPAAHAGSSELFIMAAFDVSGTGDTVGTWQLEYREENGSWASAGNQAQRTVSANAGIVTIVALADVSSAGNYEARLVHRSESGATLTTHNVDLVAISLSVSETEYLQSYEADSVTTPGGTMNISLEADMDVFIAANITANSTQDFSGTYSLLGDNGASTTSIAASNRDVDSRSFGSIGLSGIASFLAADANSVSMEVDSKKLGFSSDSNLVAFGLTTVPEPGAITAVIGIGALFLAFSRRSWRRH